MTRYSKTMSESLAEVREGFSPKQIKMAIGIANDPRYKGGNYSGAVKQIEKIKKGLSNHKQVAAVLKRLNTDFDPEIKDDEEMNEASARRDAMRHGAGGRRGIDPADKDDVKATDKDKELAKKNMIMQLRKSKDTKGNFSIEFQDGKKQKVDPKFVELLLKAHDMIQKPRDKEQFVGMISKSYRDMLKTAKMVSKQLRMGEEISLDESVMNAKVVGFQVKDALGKAKIRHKFAKKGNKFIVSVDQNDEEDAQKIMKDHPLYIAGKLRVVPESVEEAKEEYVCEDCGCEQGNADPNCDCPNDSTDLQASYWMKKEEFEIDEMKMDDPKLNKIFDKLKKGQTIKLKTSSTISKGKDFVDYIVKSKNTVNKGRVEKVTLVTKGNEKAVKKFLYKRDGKVTFAIGDMGASIDDIKEEMNPTDHVKKKGDKYCVYNADGSIAKEFDNKEDADKYAIDNHDKLMATAEVKESVISEEEEPQKSDGAKAVDQGREDKKKTRIAALQLQIAKAQETINQLNAQEK